MNIHTLKTERITPRSTTLTSLLDRVLVALPERSILAITSKIVALAEGRVIRQDHVLKKKVIVAEAEYYLPETKSQYGVPLTIVDHTFIARAGLDTSNTNGHYSLLPKNSYVTAKKIRQYLIRRFDRKEIGVIIVDSHSLPLRRGVTGVAIGWSGFKGLKEYKNVPDIFNRSFTTHANHVDALATAASFVMGDGNEQTPLALITDIPNIEFKASSPTPQELAYFKPKLKDDLFAPLLNLKLLKKGRRSH